MTVFDVFKTVPYDYLTISQSQILGDMISGRKTLTGVFKERSGMSQSGNIEIEDSAATLHVRPEDFEIQNCQELVGNGVEVNGRTYTIKGATAGTNFDNGMVEYYTLTLKPAVFTEGAGNGD